MMYWEALFPSSGQTAASDMVEEAAKYVQWAMYGSTSAASDSDKEDEVRYNLDQFNQIKARAYQAENALGKKQLDRLESIAQGLINAIDSGKLFTASPSYWEYWKAFLFGGTPARPDTTEVANEARQAALDAASAAEKAGQPVMVSFFRNQAANVETNLQDSNKFWNQAGITNVGGIPWWVWMLIAGGAYVFLTRRGK